MPFYNYLLALPVLFVTLLVHEIGHFWAARWMKVRIEEFGIGYPPRILSLGRRNGVEYTLNWIPLGGFVRLAGEDDPGVENGLGSKKPGQRATVLVAGAFMNLLLALILFTGLAMYGELQVVSDQVGVYWVEPGSPAERAGVQAGDLFVEINGRAVTDQEDIAIETILNRGYTITLLLQRDGQRVSTSLVPRKEPPPGEGAMGIRMAYYESPVVIQRFAEDAPAALAGLREGDVIVAVDGQPVDSSLQYRSYLAAHENQTLQVTVQRDGSQMTVPVYHGEDEVYPLGLDYLHVAFRSYSLPTGIVKGLQETVDAGLLVPRTIAAVIRTSVPVSDISGPVGIVGAAATVAQYGGLYGLVRLTGVISINLFLINLFPLPALDGGRLAFVLLEWIRGGRRLSPEKEGLVHLIGFFLLIAFGVLITYYDIARLASGGLGGP